MKLPIVSWALSLSVSLAVIVVSWFSFSPDAGRIRDFAIGCSIVLAVGLCLQLRRLP